MSGIYRYIQKADALGRILNARQYWELLGIHVGEPVEIVVDAQRGCLTVRKITVSCVCCGETDNLRILKDNVYLCTKCIERMQGTLDVDIPLNYLCKE